MRTERSYAIEPWLLNKPEAETRREWGIEETVTQYCEDPACEAQHEDPSAKWDWRNHRTIAVCYSAKDAEIVCRALEFTRDGWKEAR